MQSAWVRSQREPRSSLSVYLIQILDPLLCWTTDPSLITPEPEKNADFPLNKNSPLYTAVYTENWRKPERWIFRFIYNVKPVKVGQLCKDFVQPQFRLMIFSPAAHLHC